MNKKAMAVLTAAGIIPAMTGNVSSFAFAENSDVLHLQNVILGIEEPEKADDINADGKVDVCDLCMLKEKKQSSEEFKKMIFNASSENVKTTGRYLYKNDVNWLVQSGSAVSFSVTGKSASVTLAGDSSIENGEDYRPRYAVLVDGEIIADNVMSDAEKEIKLFDEKVSRTAEVKIIHLSEAMNGAVGVKNITVETDKTTPVLPAAKKKLNIEFIGDSITCAYGVEGKSSSESFKTTTENFMKSYAYLAAEKLDADYSAVSYSGHGVLSGFTTSGDINKDSIVPDYYTKVGKLPDYNVEWDFESAQSDVVVINLGTNDSSYVSKEPETRSVEFVDAYVDFLGKIREKNPDAHIICTVGTMGGDMYPYLEEAVKKYSEKTGDSKVTSYESKTQNFADGVGSDWHPSETTQKKNAYVLADKICEVLGIESDKVGLDVTADSEYKLNMPEGKGGNAAFYVGYDKSFWINMVTGGNTPDAIEAEIADITLNKGGTYRLEFDCTSTYDGKLPVMIKGSDGTVYFSDKFEAVADKTHYLAEINIENDDKKASIIYQLGGKDSYNVTFSNISLTKISQK